MEKLLRLVLVLEVGNIELGTSSQFPVISGDPVVMGQQSK